MEKFWKKIIWTFLLCYWVDFYRLIVKRFWIKIIIIFLIDWMNSRILLNLKLDQIIEFFKNIFQGFIKNYHFFDFGSKVGF